MTFQRRTPRAGCGRDCDKMDSSDQREMFIVKIETDVAEEPPVAWRTEYHKQGQQKAVAFLTHSALHQYVYAVCN